MLANDFDELDDPGSASDGVDLEPSSLCPGVRIVMMSNVAEDRLLVLLVYDDPQVTIDPNCSKALVPGSVYPMRG
jgi:hypothetical protein